MLVTRSGRLLVGDTLAGDTEQLRGTRVGPGLTRLTGVAPLLGREITDFDTMAAAPPVTLLGHAYWQRKFAGDSAVLGRVLPIDGRDHVVIGIMPPGFAVPMHSGTDLFPALQRLTPGLTGGAVALLREGTTVEQANQELAEVWATYPRPPGDVRDVPRVARPADLVDDERRMHAILMFGAATVVLLVVCANVANLMLARAWSRRREFAIRAAIGAGRARLTRQVLAESAMLAVFGALLGVAVAAGTLRLFASSPSAGDGIEGAGLGAPVLGWALVLSVGAALLFGLGPALSAGNTPSDEALKSGARGSPGGRWGRRFRTSLVVGEVALSVVLLAGAGLLVRTLVAMKQVDVGFDPQGIGGIEVRLAESDYPEPESRAAVVDAVLAEVRAVPGVAMATVADDMPPDFVLLTSPIEVEGRPPPPEDDRTVSSYIGVRPEYFRLVGMPILQGVEVAPNPAMQSGGWSTDVIVNASLARRLWPGEQAVGRKVRFGTSPWATVVGVVPDVPLPGASGQYGRSRDAQIYGAMPRAPTRFVVVFRSERPFAAVVAEIETAIRAAAPLAALQPPRSADTVYAAYRSYHRAVMRMIGGSALLALLLALVGLHAVIAYAVSLRSREFGVRVALGARGADVVRMVLGHGVQLAALGLVIGLVVAAAIARLASALLYGVRPADPLTMAAVAAVLLGTTLVAVWRPARRAANTDPAEVLRLD
jgi:predicted permease